MAAALLQIFPKLHPIDMPITHPIFLARANRRLKRHVKQRLESPALASPRFTGSAEGQQVVQRLARSVGRLNARGALPIVLGYVLVIAAMLTPSAAANVSVAGTDGLGFAGAVVVVSSRQPAANKRASEVARRRVWARRNDTEMSSVGGCVENNTRGRSAYFISS